MKLWVMGYVFFGILVCMNNVQAADVKHSAALAAAGAGAGAKLAAQKQQGVELIPITRVRTITCIGAGVQAAAIATLGCKNKKWYKRLPNGTRVQVAEGEVPAEIRVAFQLPLTDLETLTLLAKYDVYKECQSHMRESNLALLAQIRRNRQGNGFKEKCDIAGIGLNALVGGISFWTFDTVHIQDAQHFVNPIVAEYIQELETKLAAPTKGESLSNGVSAALFKSPVRCALRSNIATDFYPLLKRHLLALVHELDLQDQFQDIGFKDQCSIPGKMLEKLVLKFRSIGCNPLKIHGINTTATPEVIAHIHKLEEQVAAHNKKLTSVTAAQLTQDKKAA